MISTDSQKIYLQSNNSFNLTSVITFGNGNTATYVYDVVENKLSVVYYTSNGTAKMDYAGNKVYGNGTLSMILTEEGSVILSGSTPTYYYYLKDHQGNNRVVINHTVQQVNHYYAFGGLFGEGLQSTGQPYKYNGKELDTKIGLNMYDYGARHYDAALGRWFTVDPLAEKYYGISQYVYVANNPVNYIDLRGYSLTILNDNIHETIMALYNGLESGINFSFKFNNGVLCPSSIEEQVQNSADLFLQDIYEIAINPIMIELSISDKNTYMMNGKIMKDEFASKPYDYDIRMESLEVQRQLMAFGEVPGKTIQGNLGQTLIPGNISASGKTSTNNNVQVIINGKGTLNHRTVGIAHEFGHVILYLRGLSFGHGQPGVDDFIYNRSTIRSKRLGYDY